MRALPIILLTLTATLASPGAGAAEPMLSAAWIALPPPGAQVAAGYLVLENRTDAPLRIVGVRVAGFADAMVHESYLEGGSMRMRMRPTLDVAAGARLELAPGGLHLMLFDPAAPLAVGAVHEIALELADGRTLTVRATVRDLRASHH